MDKALTGFLGVFGILHLLLVVVPVTTTLRASISGKSKILWCGIPRLASIHRYSRISSSIQDKFVPGKTLGTESA